MNNIAKNPIHVGFVGNPNCGKTTLFNAITGAKLKVANWPGVTVEKKEGSAVYKGKDITLIDLPGIYSLTSYTIEEIVTRNCILQEDVDVIINIVDASCLERNLYLTLQLLELGKPVIIALNMMDIVEQRGMEIDLHRLPEMLGNVPVVPVSARKRTGLDVLLHAVVHHYNEEPAAEIFRYNTGIEAKIARLEEEIVKTKSDVSHTRWMAIKLLEHDKEVMKDFTGNPLLEHVPDSNEKEIISQKYEYIEEIVEDTLFNKEEKSRKTDNLDKWFTHRIWGLPIFLTIMAFVFVLTFTVGDALKGVFEVWLGHFSDWVYGMMINLHVSKALTSLVVDGIIAGVGGILTFLPNIFILFLALAFLEDSGYMARVAYVMDGIMGKVGLSGKSFLPMILGFGCSVPAVMATRALDKESDRRKLMLIIPFMSCSAKLPIYVLFASMFFGKGAMLAAYSMYIIGLVLAIVVAKAANMIMKQEEESPLLIELPEYKSPDARTIAIYVWEKVKDYLTRAGTIIFAASIILWFLLNFSAQGLTANVEESFGALLGRWLVPVLAPAGLGLWQIGVALISGLSAKEVVVSSFAVLFGISNINSAGGMSSLRGILSDSGFGLLNAYSLMLFCLLYTPCIATIGTMRRESKSWSFTLKVLAFQLFIAWFVSTVVFQIGSLFI